MAPNTSPWRRAAARSSFRVSIMAEATSDATTAWMAARPVSIPPKVAFAETTPNTDRKMTLTKPV